MKKLLVLVVLAGFLGAPLHGETVQFDENWGPAGFALREQSPAGFVLNFSLEKVSFHTQRINGEPMTVIEMPGAMLGNNVEAPNLPGVGRFFAVPQQAAFNLEIVKVRSHLFKNLDIAPARNIPLDTDDSMPVYKKDPLIYNTNAYYPESPAVISEPRIIRGVDAGLIGITPFQYNPVTRDLLVYSDIEVKVTFQGGNGHFGEDRLRSRFFDPILKMHLLNADMLPEINYTARSMGPGGASEAEYIIICPDDANYKDWAQVLKEFRILQGITTQVCPLSQVGYSSNAIKDWIHNAVKNWSNPPVAVLLLGDAPGEGAPAIPVPSWSYTPSDNIYADVFGNDDLPDLVITRICPKTLAELEEMVMKQIAYETSPPTNPTFYDCPTIAAGWQSDRWFVICADIVHGFFNHAQGRRPNREYSGYSGTPSYWSTNQNTHMLVDYFGEAGLEYIPDVPSHLNNWSGNATSINNCFNAGSFFALHRDHGSSSGWSDPNYEKSHLSGLSNDPDLPVVLSINCSSGAFSSSSSCFAEAMTRMNHGAVAVIAASATSYSFVNDTYVFGMMDSFFPSFDPGYGSLPPENILMPGFANASGKFYLEASNWPYNPTSKPITYHLFHDHGDAFFTMGSEIPQSLTVSHPSTLPLGSDSIQVTADAGAFIAVTMLEGERDIRILGTAISNGGATNVLFGALNEARILTVTVTKPNHYRYTGTVHVPELGTITQYGTGLAGSGGYTPDLNGAGEVIYGGSFTVDLTEALGGATGLLYLGLTQADLPFLGGNLYVYPIDFTIPLVLGGFGPGGGGFTIPVTSYISGISIYLQVLVADGAAPKGASMSNGLEVVFP